jgi:hypothetical protein
MVLNRDHGPAPLVLDLGPLVKVTVDVELDGCIVEPAADKALHTDHCVGGVLCHHVRRGITNETQEAVVQLPCSPAMTFTSLSRTTTTQLPVDVCTWEIDTRGRRTSRSHQG